MVHRARKAQKRWLIAAYWCLGTAEKTHWLELNPQQRVGIIWKWLHSHVCRGHGALAAGPIGDLPGTLGFQVVEQSQDIQSFDLVVKGTQVVTRVNQAFLNITLKVTQHHFHVMCQWQVSTSVQSGKGGHRPQNLKGRIAKILQTSLKSHMHILV